MWILKCVFVVNIVAFTIAHPIDEEISLQNDKSIKDSSPPMEFPQNDSKFPVVDTNATLLHELSGNDDSVTIENEKNESQDIEPKSVQIQDDSKPEEAKNDNSKLDSKKQKVDDSKIDTEIPDLLTIDKSLIEPSVEPEHNDIIDDKNDSDNDPPQAHDIHENLSEEPINNVISTSTEEYPKSEVEWIQNGHDNEDVRLMADNDVLVSTSDYVREAYSEHGRGVPLVQGRYAAILAGVFIVLAVVGYAAMLSWRRYLENRYGSRQMLVNEDDMYVNANDLKHFSL